MNSIEISNQILSLIESIQAGDQEALINYIEIKNLMDQMDQAMKEIKDQALREAAQYHGSSYRGYQIEIREGGGRYAYDHIPEWAEMKEKIKEIEKRAQMAYKMANQRDLMISEDGEIISPAKFQGNSPSLIVKIIK